MQTLLAFDIGGTNSRALAAQFDGAVMRPHTSMPKPELRQLKDISSLLEFVSQTIEVLGERPAATVIAAAGPSDGRRVLLTNWPGTPELAVEMLAKYSATKTTRLVNDLVAGAHGLAGELELGRGDLFNPLDEWSREIAPEGNVVYVAPGTGLGAAGIVREGAANPVVVGCESQHTPMHYICDDIGEVLDVMQSELNHPPTWEDVVSGRGLVHVYEIVSSMSGADVSDEPTAIDISKKALTGDPIAGRALEIYYRCLGRFAQLLALTFQPCTAVMFGGASTAANASFLADSGLIKEFRRGDVRAISELLRRPGLFWIERDLNLEGGLRLASRLVRSNR